MKILIEGLRFLRICSIYKNLQIPSNMSNLSDRI